MMYRCILKLKRKGLFNTIWIDEKVNERFYNSLNDKDKKHFIEDYSDESIAYQIERNQKEDDKLSN